MIENKKNKRTFKKQVNKNKGKRTAFTMAELLIVMLIVALIIGFVIQIRGGSSSARIASARSLTKIAPVEKIDGLVLWLDSVSKKSFKKSEAIDGSTISVWYDLSKQNASANNATQGACADIPTYNKKIINQLPAVTFDGVNDCLIGGPLGISGQKGATIFVVFRNTGTANDSDVFSFGMSTSTATGRRKRLDVRVGSGASGWRFLGGSRLFDQDIELNRFYISTWLNSDGDDYDNHERYLNGDISTSSSVDTTIPNIKDDEYNIGIGRNASASLIYEFQGNVGEIIVYNKRIKDYERRDIEEYLSKKWKINLN